MMDKNDIDAATRNRERIKHLQTREKKEEIVDRYQKGDKTKTGKTLSAMIARRSSRVSLSL